MLIIMFIKAFTSVILVVLNLYWQYDDLYWLCWCKDTFIMNKLVILGSLAFESEEKCFIIVMLQCYSVLFCPLWPCRPPGPTFVSIIRVWWCQPPPLNIRLMVTADNGRTLHSHTSTSCPSTMMTIDGRGSYHSSSLYLPFFSLPHLNFSALSINPAVCDQWSWGTKIMFHFLFPPNLYQYVSSILW